MAVAEITTHPDLWEKRYREVEQAIKLAREHGFGGVPTEDGKFVMTRSRRGQGYDLIVFCDLDAQAIRTGESSLLLTENAAQTWSGFALPVTKAILGLDT